MNAIDIINDIKKNNSCSLEIAENLTDAMHDEDLLHPGLSLRFRFLFKDFDFLPSSWFKGDCSQDISDYYLGPFTNPDDILSKARETSIKYADFLKKDSITILFEDKKSGIAAGVLSNGILFFGDDNSGYNVKDTPSNRKMLERDFLRYTSSNQFDFENAVGKLPFDNPITFNAWDEEYER